jgi:hypothetical protein
MNNEWRVCDRIWGSIPSFAWMNWGNPRKLHSDYPISAPVLDLRPPDYEWDCFSISRKIHLLCSLISSACNIFIILFALLHLLLLFLVKVFTAEKTGPTGIASDLYSRESRLVSQPEQCLSFSRANAGTMLGFSISGVEPWHQPD